MQQVVGYPGDCEMSLIECELSRVVMDETHARQIVVLKEKGGERQMSIAIGFFEIWAIHRTINDEPPPRPLTHELFGSVLDKLQVRIERVVVTELRKDTFIGRLFLRQNGQQYDIDSRPSDGIALAVQKDAPIYVEEEVLDAASRPF